MTVQGDEPGRLWRSGFLLCRITSLLEWIRGSGRMEPPWWLNWLADLASISGLSFAAIVPVGSMIVGWILGYLPPAPSPRVHLQTERPIRSGNSPRVSLFNEVYGSAYRGIVGAHRSIADQFWLIVAETVGLMICCILYVYQASQETLPVVPVIPVLQSLVFYGIAVLALITVLLIIRLHLRIRYENALLAQQHGY